MAYNETWVNDDGLEVPFGPWVSDNLDSGTNHTKGNVKELQMYVDASVDLPSVGEAHTTKDMAIPAGAAVVSARFIGDVTFDQAVEFGTSQLDGTAIDQDGLIATGTPAADTVTDGAGAVIDTVVAEDSYLVVTATTVSPTVGAGTLIVEYIL